MPRTLHADVITALSSGRIRPAMLVDVGFSGGDVHVWSGVGTLNYGGNNYLGAGNLLQVAPAQETIEIRANGVTITLSGLNTSMLSVAFNQVEQKRRVVCRIAFLDENDAIIGADPYVFFEGRVDTVAIDEGADTSSIKITAESEMMVLRQGRRRRYTREDQQAYYPDDEGFNMVTALHKWDGRWNRPMSLKGNRPDYIPPEDEDEMGRRD